MQIETLIDGLRRPGALGDAGPVVAVGQTHISILLFTETRVFKIKKPVDMGFLDYTRQADRRHYCEEEVRLNRRLAPDIYLGVADVTRDETGRITIGGDGEVIDHAVVMRRLPAERMLDRLLDRGEIDNARLETVCRRLVEFHRAAATGPGVDEFAHPDEIRRQVEENLDQMDAAPPVPATASGAVLRLLRRWCGTFIDEHRARMEQRLTDGRVREGHGDLHAGNICFTDDDVVIYDCIEFTPRFRCRDVACELAFLAMDLDARRFRGFGRFLLRRYAELAGDDGLWELAVFYKLHLALVRSKVASLRSLDPDLAPEAREDARVEAVRYLQLAATYPSGACLVLTCGLPGTGKSTTARAIADPFEAIVLRTDAIRKELAGLGPAESGRAADGEGIYTPEMSRRTYDTVLARARAALRTGRPVIVDAAFMSADRRRPFLDLAAAEGLPFLVIATVGAETVVRERLAARGADATEISDADWAVHTALSSRFEPPDEIPGTHRMTADATAQTDEVVLAALERLVRQRAPGCGPTPS